MRTKLFAALVLIVPALCLVPIENRIHQQRQHLKTGGAHVTRQIRDQIGQGMAIGLLAGFRGIVADFVWLSAHEYWERREWLRQYRNMEVATTLQPQSVLFWDLGHWHMAWNIAYAVRRDPENPTEATGIKRERDWQERAREFLERGIANVPNRWDLYFRMGWLYREKLVQHCGDNEGCRREMYCKAAEYFGRAAEFPDAPPFVGRAQARALANCGKLADALALWKKLQQDTRINPIELRVIDREMRQLEERLKARQLSHEASGASTDGSS
jgi:tetratricopeptide (TPR) repeat protein